MELMSAQEAADLLGMTRAAIYLAAEEGRLPCVRKKPFIFDRAAVEEYGKTAGQKNGFANRKREEETNEQS